MAEDLCLSVKLRNEITARRDIHSNKTPLEPKQTSSLELPTVMNTNPFDSNRVAIKDQIVQSDSKLDEHLKRLKQ